MDHRSFAAGLAADTKAALTARSDAAGLRHLAGHAGLIGLSGLWLTFGPWWWLALPLHGVFLVFLFTLEHEATHKTPFANPVLNDWVGRVCGVVVLLPFEWFRYFHLAHHRWTNIAGQDPELEGAKPETLRDWLWHVSGLPYWLSEGRLLARLVRGQGMADFVPPGARGRVVAEARAMAAVYLAVALSLAISSAAFWYWLLPVVLGQPVLRLYLLAEHGDCPQVANMFENTRTTLTTRFVRVLAWNMPYHVEHHVLPNVPFHHLPQVHQLMRQELRVTADGYGAFTRAYLARRL